MRLLLKKIAKIFGYRIEKINIYNSIFFHRSFSQCGEDLIIDYIFNLRNVSNPIYVDIGANKPFDLNNTAIFYAQGCRGINIDANPLLIKQFQKSRPHDINLNIGIAAVEGNLDFYIMEDDTLSTFSRTEKDFLTASGKKLVDTKSIKVQNINNILTQYLNEKSIDLLTIDVEGLDYEIIKSLNFQSYSPKIICVEAAEYSKIGAGKRKDGLIDFLVSKNYYEYANTNLNAIMVRRDFWFINE